MCYLFSCTLNNCIHWEVKSKSRARYHFWGTDLLIPPISAPLLPSVPITIISIWWVRMASVAQCHTVWVRWIPSSVRQFWDFWQVRNRPLHQKTYWLSSSGGLHASRPSIQSWRWVEGRSGVLKGVVQTRTRSSKLAICRISTGVAYLGSHRNGVGCIRINIYWQI